MLSCLPEVCGSPAAARPASARRLALRALVVVLGAARIDRQQADGTAERAPGQRDSTDGADPSVTRREPLTLTRPTRGQGEVTHDPELHMTR